MPLDQEIGAQRWVGFRRRKEQLVEKALLGLTKANYRSVVQAVEIKGVLLESQQRKLASLGVELLAVAVGHNNAWSCRRFGEEAALGEDCDRALRIAVVVNQQAGDFASVIAIADVDCELVGDRGESPFLKQARDKTVADLELEIFERAVRRREKISRQAQQNQKGDTRQDQNGSGQREMAQPDRAHRDEFAFGRQPVEGEEHGNEGTDRQNDIKKTR